MNCEKSSIHVPRRMLVILVLLAAPLTAVAAQEGDAVAALADEFADAAGRMLTTTQTVVAGDGELTVAVGDFTWNDQRPRAAGFLQAAMEEGLVEAAERLAGRRAIHVLGSSPAAMTLEVTGSGGSTALSFVLRARSETDRILATTRITVDRNEALATALEPVPVATAGPTGGPAGSVSDDAGDSPQDARSVTLDRVVGDLALQREGDADWFVFDTGPIPADLAGEPAVSAYTTGNTDTYIEVYGPDDPNSFVTENDDTQGTNASVTFVVEADRRYWVHVRGFADMQVGGYDLHLETTTLTMDPGEPNETRDDATALRAEDMPYPASLRPAGDVDFYHLDVGSFPSAGGESAGAGSGEVSVVTIETRSDLDTVITVYDGAGTEVAYNDDGGEMTNARVPIPADAGEVYLEVRGYGDWVSGQYELMGTVETLIQDEYEPDDSRDQARALELGGGTQQRRFTGSNDVDWVTITVPEGGSDGARVVIETYGDVDTYLRLEDDNGTQIDYSDDDGSGFNARIEAALAPGVYWVEMTPLYLGDAVEYRVEARLQR